MSFIIVLVNKSKKIQTATIIEEVFNSITHGLGAITGIVGLVLGIIFISASTSFKVGYIIYASSLVILMLSSMFYHSLIFTKANKVFRAIDHSSIFILIAGTFTPFAIYLYSGWSRLFFLAAIWGIAIAGISITTTLLIPKKMKLTGVLIYVCFGWLGLLLLPKMNLVGSSVTWLLIFGGLLYTLGTISFALKKSFAHFSWHLFVIGGACAHYFAVIRLV